MTSSIDRSMNRLFAVVSHLLSCGVVLLMLGGQVLAQGRLDARYNASLAGITLGKGAWIVEIADDQYSSSVSGATSGLLKVFSGGQGQSGARGLVNSGALVPSSYYATINADKKVEQIRMILSSGSVKEFTIDPPAPMQPERIPVTEAALHGVADPLSSSLIRVSGNADPVSPEACNVRSSVFDGRMRYDLALAFKRIEIVKAEGYQGPAVVCSISFSPVAGYIPGRPAIKYLEEQRDMEVTLAPISGTRFVVPFRISVPTPLGTAALDATQFITSAQPHVTPTSAKSQ
jgi:hypothetical protein